MSKILSITWYRPAVFIVEFDNGYKTFLHSKIVWEHELEVGMDISKEQFVDLMNDDIKVRLHQSAIEYLYYHDYSAEEMKIKLRQDSRRTDLIDLEVEHLKDIKLIDDDRFAERLANRYVHIKKYGYHRAMRELIRHGIDKLTAEEALQSFEDEYEGNLQALLETKHSRYLTDPRDRQAIKKVTTSLLRYGYEPAEVKLAIKDYFTANDKPEET